MMEYLPSLRTRKAMTLIGATAIGYLLFCMAVFSMPRPPKSDFDPILSLSDPTLSARFHSAYWNRKRSIGSKRWKKALEICAQPQFAVLPNCLIVKAVAASPQDAGMPSAPAGPSDATASGDSHEVQGSDQR